MLHPIETRTYTITSSQKQEHGKRTLPNDCKWEAGSVIEKWRLDKNIERGDVSNAPQEGATIGEYIGTIDARGYGSIVHYQAYEKVLSSKKRNIELYTNWYYKDGYFNPWIQGEIFELYLRSKGLPGIEGVYKEHTYSISLVGLPEYSSWDPWKPRVNLCLYSENEEIFNELASIMEEYFISGYRPGDYVLQQMLKKYTPVRIENRSYFSGYHDENDDETTFYNAEDEVIAKVQKRDYSMISQESDIWPLCDFLKKNTGEAQVFGL